MEHNQRTDKATGAGLRNQRPVIGCLTPLISVDNGQAFWLGLTDAARKRDAQVICFPGGCLSDPRGFQAQANVLYELVNAGNVEGVVSWGTAIGSYTDIDGLRAFHERYRPLPVMIAGGVLEGFPSLLIDSYTSMRAAIDHLIEAHGYCRLAFIRGPESSFHAQERYRAYVDTLEAHGLPADPRLVTPPLPWDCSTGREAARLLLDERGLRPHTDFEAVVGAADELLLGALEVLQARGVRIPDDVAAVGADNLPEGKAHTPPLTSVAAPFYEMGYRAAEMLLSVMEGAQVARETITPQLVIRQSCGCLDPAIVQAAVDLEDVSSETFAFCLASQREQVLSAMAQAVGESSKNAAQGWGERLLEGFARELKGELPGLFLQELGQVLRQTMAAGGDVSAWQGAVSALRRQIALSLDGAMLRRAENLWQQARVMIGETAQRAQTYQAFQAARQAQTLREIETTLLTTLDVAGLMDMLAQNLPRLGIPGCCLALYEDPQPYRYPQPAPEWSRLVLAYTEQGRVELEPGGRRFRSCELAPEGVLSQDRQYNLVVDPLYFRENQLGFVLFEVGPHQGTMYETLRAQISGALQGAMLVKRVQERSAEIARQKYILDTFMANVPDCIYFKDRESRFIRSNQAHARLFGLPDPAQLVGKSDFDFYPAEQVEPRYAQEQEILRTGQPLLNFEESNLTGIWTLTTKIPLRDEHGAIVGTFGISRDITDLKKAQQALQAANSEISVLNTQLQADNLRMSAELHVVKQLQQMILPRPQELANIPGLDIVGYMQPADEVGGDYYDVLHDNGCIHIGIGDVTGHGLESGVIMLMTQAAIRTLIEHGETDPVKFVNTLNRLIYKNVERMRSERNLTFALVQYQAQQFKLVGQHEDVLVVRQGGQVERVDTMDLGFQVGLVDEISEWVHAATIALQPGDGIVLYTDGITEAENTARQQYGLDRLCAVISQHWRDPAEAIKQAVVDDVMAHIGAQKVYDDITLVVVKQQ